MNRVLFGALLVVVAAIYIGIRVSFAKDQVYVAGISKHNVTLDPATKHSRWRYHEHTFKEKDDYFQWWNYLVFDSVSRRHWTIAYGMTWNRADGLVGACTVIERHDATTVVTGSSITRFGERFAITNDFDVVQKDKNGNVIFRHTVIDPGTYRLEGKTADISFDLTVRRINGNYVGEDMEENGRTDCGVMSTYYGYHSQVEGVIRSRTPKDDKNSVPGAFQDYQITLTKQFRAYAAGSFGCHLPFGVPPIDYPWYWFWLVIPNDDVNKDIGIACGAGRVQDRLGSLDLDAGLSMIDLREQNIHQTTRFARILYNTPLQTYLMATASTGYFSNTSISVSNWDNVTDALGTARVPLTQVYHVATQAITMTVEFRVKPGQYFRIPFKHYNLIYSDFRAVGVDTHVFIQMKDSGKIIFNDWVYGMNAVEYAYAAPFPAPTEMINLFRPSISD